ncbi:MAG TPA: hypothetical protein PLF21_07890 [Exilispira sp.]|nr:hypothetical protein [Exilispira sp.]
MNLTNQINEKLIKVIKLVLINPLIHFSESDIQMLIARELMTIPELNPDENLYETNCTIGIN